MEIEKKKGSVYQEWNEDIRRRYIRILDLVIKNLIETPYYPFTITEIDVLKITEAAKAMNIDISDRELWDKDEFFKLRGEIIRKAIEKVEEFLRPTDPYAEGLAKIADYDIRQMEGERE